MYESDHTPTLTVVCTECTTPRPRHRSHIRTAVSINSQHPRARVQRPAEYRALYHTEYASMTSQRHPGARNGGVHMELVLEVQVQSSALLWEEGSVRDIEI